MKMTDFSRAAPAAGNIPPAAFPSSHAGSAAFRAGPGAPRRVMGLRDAGPLGALRSGLSLLYARLTVSGRLQDMRDWSDGAVKFQAMLLERGLDHPAVSGNRIAQLLTEITAGCSDSVHPKVVRMIAKRYCRVADTAQLAALRHAFGSPDEGSSGTCMPMDAAADAAGDMLRTMLDSELARRKLATPLKDLIRVLEKPFDADALDKASARLAARIAAGPGVAGGGPAGARHLLKAAIGQLTSSEMLTLKQFAARETQAAFPRYLSPDLRDRRELLARDLRDAASAAIGERLGCLVHETAELIEYRYGKGCQGHQAYDLAHRSLTKTLDGLRYAELCDGYATDGLAQHIVLRALDSLGPESLGRMLTGLKPDMLGDLVRTVDRDAAAIPLAAIPADVDWAVRREHERRLYDTVADQLRVLNNCLPPADSAARMPAPDRWAALRELAILGLSMKALAEHRHLCGTAMRAEVEDDLRSTMRRLDPLLRSPGNHAGPLGHASISVLCESEVRLLRDSEPYLGQYGLQIDPQALREVAIERSLPYKEKAVAQAQALIQALADKASATGRIEREPIEDDALVSRIVRALCHCADALRSLRQERANYIAITPEDLTALSGEVMREAREALAGRRPDAIAQISADAVAFCLSLGIGLRQAAQCLTSQPHDGGEGDDTDWARQTAQHASSLMRGASYFASALESELTANAEILPDGARGARPDSVSDESVAAAWTPAVCRAVSENFGVHYDPQRREASPVMTPARHKEFIDLLLAESMPAVVEEQREIATPDGPLSIVVGHQFIVDGIVRQCSSFSVRGIGVDGSYVPYTSSASVPGDDSHVEGIDRALPVLYRLAGPHTPALTSYLSQIVGCDFVMALHRLGRNSPLKLSDGSPATLASAVTKADVTRMADGSYRLDLTVLADKLSSVLSVPDPENFSMVSLDEQQSYASVSYTVQLRIGQEGEQRHEKTRPVDLRFRLYELSTPPEALGQQAFEQQAYAQPLPEHQVSGQHASEGYVSEAHLSEAHLSERQAYPQRASSQTSSGATASAYAISGDEGFEDLGSQDVINVEAWRDSA
jgi:hypothetical protein